MKKVFAVLFTVLLVAGTAYAVDFEADGMMYVRGSAISNDSGTSNDDTASFMYYDQELDMNTRLKVTDQTLILLNFEIHDQDWITGNTDGQTTSVDDVVLDEDGNPVSATGPDLDDNIEIKRTWLSHTFGTGTKLELGLMTGGTWAYSFGETANGRWRVKVTQPIPAGTLLAILEKNAELGSTNPDLKDSEKDDGDAYYVAGIFPVGDINIKPLLGYSDASNTDLNQDSDGTKTSIFLLGVDGNLGMIGFEAEFDYLGVNEDFDGGNDYSLYGLYANGWTTLDAIKLGGQIAYGSYDDDDDVQAGYGFGEDYTPTIFGADWTGIGSTTNSEYYAVTLFQVYGDYTASEQLSFHGSITYWLSNEKDTFWEDATGYEVDLSGDYKITDNVTYTVAGAWAQFNLDEDSAGYDDADAAYRIYHKFTVDF